MGANRAIASHNVCTLFLPLLILSIIRDRHNLILFLYYNSFFRLMRLIYLTIKEHWYCYIRVLQRKTEMTVSNVRLGILNRRQMATLYRIVRCWNTSFNKKDCMNTTCLRHRPNACYLSEAPMMSAIHFSKW